MIRHVVDLGSSTELSMTLLGEGKVEMVTTVYASGTVVDIRHTIVPLRALSLLVLSLEHDAYIDDGSAPPARGNEKAHGDEIIDFGLSKPVEGPF